MIKFKTLFIATAATVLLASCGSGTDETPAADATAGAAMDMDDPNNPFAAAEMAMNDKMMTAIGADVSDTWVKQMIEHHRGAIAMSEVVLERNPTPDVRAMARQTIAMQGKETEDLTRLLSTSPADPVSLEPFKPANRTMHEAMMAAKGADVSETYLRKMAEHHRGAIALSDVVLAKGATGRVRAAAQKVRADQSEEIAMIEAMLEGEPMPKAASASEPAKATAGSPAPKATPAPKRPAAGSAPAKAAPRPTPTPSATTDPHAGMKM
ncbi:MAG: DUF305 domain-containing protein [Novosphingobium sp.]|nr:DUF305 domain-containing protein [Novosphingobium sp.]